MRIIRDNGGRVISIEIGMDWEYVEAGNCSFLAVEATLDGEPTGCIGIVCMDSIEGLERAVDAKYLE